MKHQALRPIALMLGVLLLAAKPAQAGPVEYRDVVSLSSVFGQSGRPAVDLRLRALTQQQARNSQQTAPSAGQGAAQDQSKASGQSAAPAEGGQAPADSLTGIEVAPQQTATNVETIQLGEVDGTLCDCGEIVLPGGGFPLWPLLGLAGIPLFFLPGDEDTPPLDFPTPPPPTVPPDVIPEPTTLLLFGTGLLAAGAGARRRRSRQQAKTLEATEV